MERSVSRLNIQHYKHLLETETDEPKREMIKRLLAEEEGHLAKIVGPPKSGATVKPPRGDQTG